MAFAVCIFLIHAFLISWLLFGSLTDHTPLLFLYIVFVLTLMFRYYVNHQGCTFVQCEKEMRGKSEDKDTIMGKIFIPLYSRPTFLGIHPHYIYGAMVGSSIFATYRIIHSIKSNS